MENKKEWLTYIVSPCELASHLNREGKVNVCNIDNDERKWSREWVGPEYEMHSMHLSNEMFPSESYQVIWRLKNRERHTLRLPFPGTLNILGYSKLLLK